MKQLLPLILRDQTLTTRYHASKSINEIDDELITNLIEMYDFYTAYIDSYEQMKKAEKGKH